MRKFIVTGLAAIAVLVTPAIASASITLNTTTGIGFVGKGDVQTAFEWNDAALQKNASGVSFKYKATTDDAYEVTCEWDTGNKHIVHHVQTKSNNLLDTVAYDLKSGSRVNPNSKVTGFNLTGIANTTTTNSGTVPVVGAPCPATGNEDGTDNSVTKLITGVDLLSSTTTEKFFAYFNGERELVYPTPIVTVV